MATLMEANKYEHKVILEKENAVDLCLLGVDSDYRNQRIGTKLVEFSMKIIS